MSNQDKKLIDACSSKEVEALFQNEQTPDGEQVKIAPAYPLDEDVIKELKKLSERMQNENDEYEIFRHRKKVDELWGLLLEKAVICLRFYDTREPFGKSNGTKKPKAYGIEDLKAYYEKYTKFERVLYGSGRYYRDHVIHVFRTWLLGVEQLVKNSADYLDNLAIREKKIVLTLNRKEKLSMWTIIALTHDLGYPLEKAKSIIDVTRDMLTNFIADPNISVDFSFHGVQNYMNDFVLRLMSSKMDQRQACQPEKNGKDGEETQPRYVARLQSKYYFKFQKSLERNKHGILSSLIIYKMLTYFLESDYNLNEDYKFDEEECRQFYIRREILRAIASHTCDDIYQMYMGSFSFLLRICDDTQEWGRKNISELYVKSAQTYELEDIALNFGEGTANTCTIRETMTLPDQERVKTIFYRFHKQALTYVTIFRDGQDTSLRDFAFERKLTIKCEKIKMEIQLKINNDEASKLTGVITYVSDHAINQLYGKDFFEEMLGKMCKGNSGNLPKECFTIYDTNRDKIIDETAKKQKWDKGQFTLPLSV